MALRFKALATIAETSDADRLTIGLLHTSEAGRLQTIVASLNADGIPEDAGINTWEGEANEEEAATLIQGVYHDWNIVWLNA